MISTLGNALLLAMRELWRNVMRSILTMLGIIIGVAAVIILVTLGSGATKRVTEQIASLGSDLLMVSPGKRIGSGQGPVAAPFKVADAEAIARDVPGLNAVAPVSSRSITAIHGNENWATTVTGSSEQCFPLSNRRIREGGSFNCHRRAQRHRGVRHWRDCAEQAVRSAKPHRQTHPAGKDFL